MAHINAVEPWHTEYLICDSSFDYSQDIIKMNEYYKHRSLKPNNELL